MKNKFNHYSKSFLIAFSALVLFSGCQASNSAENNIYGYTFQTAKITYKISGYTEGTSQVFIKGNKKIIKNDLAQKQPDGTMKPIKSITILNGDRFYALDPVTKIASSSKNPLFTELQSLTPEQRAIKIIQQAVHATSTADMPKPEKQEEIQGQKCDLYQTSTATKTCLWLDIPLRSITSLPENGIQVDSIATKIELNTPINDNEFDVPSDYQIKTIN